MRYMISLLMILLSYNSWANEDLYVYPNSGQNQEQQDRDRFECHNWAVSQTGFDPSRASSYPVAGSSSSHHRGYRRGHHGGIGNDPITGAARGAAIGAVGGAIGGDAGLGAAIGAGVGAVKGLFRQWDNRHSYRKTGYGSSSKQLERLREQRADYNRAMGACLEGRDYTVR